MLSQSYPNYLTQLRVSAFAIQSRQDKAIMLLTVTNFAEVLGQTVIGVHVAVRPRVRWLTLIRRCVLLER